jgi:hypothetical protein
MSPLVAPTYLMETHGEKCVVLTLLVFLGCNANRTAQDRGACPERAGQVSTRQQVRRKNRIPGGGTSGHHGPVYRDRLAALPSHLSLDVWAAASDFVVSTCGRAGRGVCRARRCERGGLCLQSLFHPVHDQCHCHDMLIQRQAEEDPNMSSPPKEGRRGSFCAPD